MSKFYFENTKCPNYILNDKSWYYYKNYIIKITNAQIIFWKIIEYRKEIVNHMLFYKVSFA